MISLLVLYAPCFNVLADVELQLRLASRACWRPVLDRRSGCC